MEDEKKPGSKKTLIIVVVIVGLLLLIGAGLAVYFFFFKKEPGTEPDDDDDVTGKTLWLMAGEGEDHSEDVTYVEAVAYCALSKGRLSTVPELTEAYNQGFEYCYPGWMLDHYLGFVMQNANDPSCPNSKNEKGCNCRSASNIPDIRYGVYCIADTLPTDDPLIKTCHVFK
jgi:hypothetical protein